MKSNYLTFGIIIGASLGILFDNFTIFLGLGLIIGIYLDSKS